MNSKNAKFDWRFFLQRLFTLIILGYFIFLASRAIIQNQKIKKEIEEINKQIREQEQKNNELQKFIEYQKTDNFKEKQLREKLGFKKEGEIVIAVPENKDRKTPTPIPTISASTSLKIPNYVLWWKYLSGK
jgi:cell division protein FtsB